jgi:beta-mannosidase
VLVSPHVEDGSLAVYVVSDKTTPQQGTLRLRIMNMEGKILRETTKAVIIDPLASKVYQQLPLSELSDSGSQDLTRTFGAVDLTIGGEKVSSNIVYFAQSKEIHLSAASISAKITAAKTGYDVTLYSPVLARSVYLSFGEQNATYSDNYVDLLPGGPITIHVTSEASLSALRAEMQVRSLADAFNNVTSGSNQ